ncbi:MAG: sulfotransferase [Desulfobacteraceae bacterium]|nr:sulfotransferase [Desulfobacteraceae bacterium]
MPTFHFISGLPRSGSTMLSAILRQNPRFHASVSSPVGSLLEGILGQVSAGSEFASQVNLTKRRAILKGLFDSYYSDVDREVIFDTNRLWSAKLSTLLDLFPNAKIIATVRNVAWVMDSLERLYRAHPFEHTRLFSGGERSTVYTRVEALGQRNRLVGLGWSALKEAFYSEQGHSLLVVDYDILAQRPREVLPLIYQFIGEPPFAHDFDHLEFDTPEYDDGLGLKGLHKVRSQVGFAPRQTILPPDLFDQYDHLSFWKDTTASRAHVIMIKSEDDNSRKEGKNALPAQSGPADLLMGEADGGK